MLRNKKEPEQMCHMVNGRGNGLIFLDTPKEVMEFLRTRMGGLQQDDENQESWTLKVGDSELVFIRTW